MKKREANKPNSVLAVIYLSNLPRSVSKDLDEQPFSFRGESLPGRAEKQRCCTRSCTRRGLSCIRRLPFRTVVSYTAFSPLHRINRSCIFSVILSVVRFYTCTPGVNPPASLLLSVRTFLIPGLSETN